MKINISNTLIWSLISLNILNIINKTLRSYLIFTIYLWWKQNGKAYRSSSNCSSSVTFTAHAQRSTEGTRMRVAVSGTYATACEDHDRLHARLRLLGWAAFTYAASSEASKCRRGWRGSWHPVVGVVSAFQQTFVLHAVWVASTLSSLYICCRFVRFNTYDMTSHHQYTNQR